jgi:hypothetical protein
MTPNRAFVAGAVCCVVEWGLMLWALSHHSLQEILVYIAVVVGMVGFGFLVHAVIGWRKE